MLRDVIRINVIYYKEAYMHVLNTTYGRMHAYLIETFWTMLCKMDTRHNSLRILSTHFITCKIFTLQQNKVRTEDVFTNKDYTSDRFKCVSGHCNQFSFFLICENYWFHFE